MRTTYAIHATPDSIARLLVTAQATELDAPTVSLGSSFVVCGECLYHTEEDGRTDALDSMDKTTGCLSTRGTSAAHLPCCLCDNTPSET
jgi:hypothetical protein